MSERPKGGVDPDATVMLPRDEDRPSPDPDATVMIPAAPADDDATVMIPAAPEDPDATVMMPTGEAEPDPEATIAIPTPGRKREAIPAAPDPGSQASAADIGALGGLNPLVAAANPILAVVPQIRQTLRHPDPDGLRASLRAGIDAFEGAARAAGADDGAIASASYALCALLDESAACTPWGANWAKSGLLAERHGESAGGEKFFLLLETVSARPEANLALLEFLYVCLALGFEGHYRDAADGRQALAEKRARLLGVIRQQQAPHDGELSGHWRGVVAPARHPSGGLALWAGGSAATLILVAVYAGYSVTLGTLSDPVTRDIAQLKVPELAAAPVPDAATPRVSAQLADEIARGEVAVTDAAGMSTIVIRSDRFFASGSARLETVVEPVLLRIAQALDRVPGTILVTGHTDDVPIRTARFPSNWELSTERAASVVKLMAGRLGDPARLRAEGLADSAPVAPNDSAANRARNRRVVIILRSAP